MTEPELREKLNQQIALNRELHLKLGILSAQHELLLKQLSAYDDRLDAHKVLNNG